MGLRIYNTLTRKKEDFVPVKPGEVRMYVCGPTVYDLLHVGNFRGAIFFNVVRNWLEKSGYKVTFVYNYTDVDDKIINRAKKENVDSNAIAEKYIQEFEKDFRALGLRKHTHNPRVTEFIAPIIQIIEKLVANGKAYVVNGEVIYSIKNFQGYGKLSGKSIDDLQAGARVEIDEKKENPLDFALWKPSKPGEPKWPSPWGDGRPGWHIECSAMSSVLLGDSFDIHGGGIDLIFPHHENEIAQSEGASGCQLARYWMHNNFINFGAQKMSKSLGNVTTARAFLEKYHPEILKYMILSAHYRTLSDFSEAPIHNAVAGLARVYSAMNLAQVLLDKAGSASLGHGTREEWPNALRTAVTDADSKIEAAMNDDFNTPEVFAAVFEVVRVFNSQYRLGMKLTPAQALGARGFQEWLAGVGELLALYQEPASQFLKTLDDMLLVIKGLKRDDIDQIVAQRIEVRAQKDFKKSDEIRDRLKAMGIAVQDTVEGTVWEVQK